MAGVRKSETAIRANSRNLDPDLRRARGKFKKFGTGVKRDLGKSFGGVRRTIGSLAGLGGVAGFAMLGRDVLQFEKKLTRLRIQSGGTKREFSKFRDEITQVSNATGESRNDIVSTAARYVSLTGDIQTARENMELFTQVAVASGSSLEDIAGVAAALRSQFKGIQSGDLREAFDIMITQGKAGSVELRQFAAELGQMGGMFQNFGRNTKEGLATLGAAFQVIQAEFGFSPEQARTGMNAFMTALLKNEKQVRKVTGVKIFDKRTGEFMNMIDILDAFKKKGVTQKDLMKALGGKATAARSASALLKNLDAMKKIRTESGKSNAVAKDYATYQESSAGQIATSWERVKNQFLKILTPQRIGKLAKAFERLADVVGFLVDHLGEIATFVIGAKMIRLGTQIGGVVGQAGALGGAMGGLLGKANALTAAFTAGFGVGTALDKWLGLSDKISDMLARLESPESKTRRSTGLLRSAAKTIAYPAATEPFLGREGPLDERQKRAARTVAMQARQLGIINPKTGKINQRQLDKVALSAKTGSLTEARQYATELGRQIRWAVKEARNEGVEVRTPRATGGSGPAPTQKVEITIKTDDKGDIVTDKKQKRTARRSR